MTMLRGLVLCYTDKRFVPNSVIRGTLEPHAEPRLDDFDGLLTCMNPGGRKSVTKQTKN